MTPAVRRLLRERGFSPADATGTRLGARITREDVTAVVETRRTSKAVPGPAPAAVSVASARRRPGRCSSARPSLGPRRPGSAIVSPPGADEVLVPMCQMRRGVAP
jgi:pyruvate/2-oxoglutarate dehydrogenase complex dihydrolipoamide acyltransferase (E2) component